MLSGDVATVPVECDLGKGRVWVVDHDCPSSQVHVWRVCDGDGVPLVKLMLSLSGGDLLSGARGGSCGGG